MKTFHKERSYTIIFQLIVLGALGAHGDPVQGHVVGAHRAVGDLNLFHVMVEQNAQDPQMLPDHVTHIVANVSKMDVTSH